MDSAAVRFLLEVRAIFYFASLQACSDEVPLSSYGPFKYGEKSKVETWISFKVNSSGAHQARHQASPPPMSAAAPVCQHLTFLTLLLLAYGWSYQRGFTENKKLKETGGFTQDLYSAEGLHTVWPVINTVGCLGTLFMERALASFGAAWNEEASFSGDKRDSLTPNG